MTSTAKSRSSAYDPLVDTQEEGVIHIEDGGKPQVIQTQYAAPRLGERYKSRSGLVTGILQISIGVILLLVEVIEIIIIGNRDAIFFTLLGMMFGSLLFIATGIVGIVSYKQRPCVIITYMILSIIAAICVAPQAAGNLVEAITAPRYYIYQYDPEAERLIRTKSACSATAAAFSLIEFVVAIVASAFCCHGVCRCSTTQTQTAVVMYDPSGPNPQIVSSTTMT